jgi:hypothetical protein
MAYYTQDQGFLIVITNKDIEPARKSAEAAFLKILGLEQEKEKACSLKVSLTVPFDVNAQASGTNYGLSFCPNGKPF